MRHRPLAALLGLAVLTAGFPASAPAGDVARSFAESDRNHDGSVDRREMERRALEVFSFADTNRDAHLSREEYDSLVLGQPFGAVDTNHDGSVSAHEFVAARTRDFDAADKNHDGVLTPDEVEQAPDKASER
jgi:Ca2+-binding EF-hand superfamily protein